jgi:hypothetical protein
LKRGENGDVREIKSFKTKTTTVLSPTDINVLYQEASEKLLAESSEFSEKESGWTLEEILHLEIRQSKYNPLRGSSYLELPSEIKSRQAVINVVNEDEECFRWAILSALHPVQRNPNRVSNYKKFAESLDFTGIPFPVTFKDISKFENLNNISVNVYSYCKDFKFFPQYITSQERDIHVDLLYVKSKATSHYCWVKDLSRLVSKQLPKT